MEKIDDKELFDKFIEDLQIQDKTKKTIENYGSCVKDYLSWLHQQGYISTDVQGRKGNDILREYLTYLRKKQKNGNGETLSHARIKIYFSALNSFYDFLLFEGFIETTNVLAVRRRYLKQYKNGYTLANRQFISVEKMSQFLKGIFNLQDKTLAIVFVKTGVRKGELIAMDVDDIDFEERTITIKNRNLRKREDSNCVVLFDEECAQILKLWLQRRETIAKDGEKALFLNEYGHRMNKHGPYNAIVYWAKRAGLHNPNKSKLSDKFGCHCLRHCWTTYLLDNKMFEPYVEWLRGDSPGKSIDKYKHFRVDKVRIEYDKAIPRFGL